MPFIQNLNLPFYESKQEHGSVRIQYKVKGLGYCSTFRTMSSLLCEVSSEYVQSLYRTNTKSVAMVTGTALLFFKVEKFPNYLTSLINNKQHLYNIKNQHEFVILLRLFSFSKVLLVATHLKKPHFN